MDDNTNNNNKTRRRIIEIIIIIIILLLLLWSCKSGLLGGNGKGDNGDKGKTKTSTKVQEEVQKASVYPTAIDGLVYTGKGQALINKGTAAKGYKFVYSLSEDGTFTKSVPTMTDAGSYVVYWRYVKKGKVIEKGSIPVSIVKAQDKATVVGASFAEDGSPHNLIASASTRFGATIMFSLDGENYSASIPQATKAGTYKVYWKSTGGNNYKGDSGSLDVTVSAKAKPEVNIEVNEGLVYNEADQTLIKSVKATEGVTVEFKVDGGEWTADIASVKAIKPGTYTVAYRTVETAKYAVTEGHKDVTIDKAELYSVELAEADLLPYIYSGQEQAVTISKVKAGKEGALVDVDLTKYGEGAYVVSGTLKATNIGTYSITVKAGEHSEYFTGSTGTKWSIKGEFGENALKIKGSDEQWSVSGANFDFTGEEIEPAFKLETASGAELELGTDYEVVVGESITKATNAGEYTIKVKGIGDYSADVNTAEATWKINSVELSTAEASYTEVEYSGNKEVPEITVKNADGDVLEEYTDYTVAIIGESGQTAVPIEQGKYTAEITGKGNYKGTKTVSWTITEDYVAKIGSVRFGSLQKALTYIETEGLSNPTIVMLQNVTDNENIVVPAGITATIDFAKYSYTIGKDKTFKIGDNATLSLKNGTVNGCITVGANDTSSIGSKLTVESGATVNNSDNCAIDITGASTLDVNGAVNGRIQTNVDSASATVNIKSGATVTEDSGVAIYIPNGVLNVNGGTIEGATGVYLKGGTLSITGGSVAGVGEKCEYDSTKEYVATGNAVVVDNRNNPTPKVLGGYFYSENNTTIGSYTADSSEAIGKFIKGGYFTDSADKLTDLVADNYAATATGEDVYISHVSDAVLPTYTVTTGTVRYYTEENESGEKITKIVEDDITLPTITPEGGAVEAGQSVMLTALKSVKLSNNDVYALEGWSIKSGTEFETFNTDASGSYTFTPTASMKLYARYKKVDPVKYHLTVNADNFTVQATGGEVDEGQVTKDYVFNEGTEITVTYTGNKDFKSWKTGSGILASYSRSYTFLLGTKTVLDAIVVDSETKTLEYVSADKKLLSPTENITEEDIETIILIDAPVKSGYEFEHWVVKGYVDETTTTLGEVTDSAGLREILTNNFDTYDSFTVTPVYTASTTTCKLTIKYPDGTSSENDVTKGKTASVTALDEVGGKQFSYWSSDEAGENVLGYDKALSIFVNEDTTVYAIYAETAAEKYPTVVLSETSKVTENSVNKIKLAITWTAPEGFVVVEQGFVYSWDPEATDADLTTTNADKDASDESKKGVGKYVGGLTSSTGTSIVKFKTTDKESLKLHAKGYLMYKRVIAGQEEVIPTIIYTNYFSGSWSESWD